MHKEPSGRTATFNCCLQPPQVLLLATKTAVDYTMHRAFLPSEVLNSLVRRVLDQGHFGATAAHVIEYHLPQADSMKG